MTVLTKELGVHGAMIARLHSELAAASAEVQRTREKANRLDARFDQVPPVSTRTCVGGMIVMDRTKKRINVLGV